MNKLVDEYNVAYHGSMLKNNIDDDYSALPKKIESSHKASKFKFGDRFRIINYKRIFSKGYTKNWSREICLIDSMLKANPST